MFSIIKNNELFNNSAYYTSLTDATNNQYHQHEFIEIFYVVSGCVVHYINGKKEDLEPFTLYLLRPNDFHNFSSYDSNPYIHRDICIRKEEFKQICDFLSPHYFDLIMNSRIPFKVRLSHENIQFLEQQFTTISPQSKNQAHFQELLYKSTISNILFNLFTQHAQLHQNMPVWIHRLASLLQNPYNFTNTLPEILQEFHYTQQHICNYFKKYMGCTITEYFTKAKLTHANFLLLSTNLSVSSIAEKVGFTSLPFFNREFKARYGQNPSSVRKNLPQ